MCYSCQVIPTLGVACCMYVLQKVAESAAFEHVLGSPRLCTDPGPPLLRASGEALPGQNHGEYSILPQQL